MYPVLFHVGAVPIETYGVVGLISYAVMVAFAAWRGRRIGVDPGKFAWAVAWATIGTLVGGRLVYALVHIDYILSQPHVLVAFWRGGIVSVGGLLGMHGAVTAYCLYSRLALGKAMDVAAMSGVLLLGLSRWACFMAGCDYGTAAPELPWAVAFSDPNTLVPVELRGLPLHPAQVYLSLGNLLVWGIGMIVNRVSDRPGTTFGTVAVLYAIMRFAMEFFRGDLDRGLWFADELSTAQVGAIVWFALGIVALVTAGRGIWLREDSAVGASS